MSRETVMHLFVLLNDDLQLMDFSGHPMPVALKVTVALTFYASASFQRAGDYVRFGTDPESQHQRALGFVSITGFPQVRGFTDCTHLAIKAPVGQPAAFLNRKGFYSLNVQLVCDHRNRFLQMCARFPGSCHDSFILCRSQVPMLFTALAQIQGRILGDKGYPLQTWLLTPVRNPASDAEKRYNACHGSTRATIEQAIEMLQMPFCCLDRSDGALQHATERVPHIVSAMLCSAQLCNTEGGGFAR
ncbi:putative nuclease HARBI1 [Heterodontus francisci]|uniref:putative nuclease HARBI1 n=1 Tax=Heterodontus francisci TaxID=7792 RepID=UPI00355B9E53